MDRKEIERNSCNSFRNRKGVMVTSQPGGLGVSPADRWLLHPFWGTVILIAVISVMLIVLGKFAAVDLTHLMFDRLFEGAIMPAVERFVSDFAYRGGFIYNLLVGQYGVFNMGIGYLFGIIVPIIACFYFFMTMLEETGYISRMALLSDRGLKHMGLSGRMTIPIILGFGCITMAFVSISTLKSQKERVIASTLIALTVPCSAQFGIILGQLAHFGPRYLFMYFAVLIIIFLITGLVLNMLIKDDVQSDFINLDPVKMPSIKNVLAVTVSKVWEFVTEALPVFVVAAAVLTMLTQVGYMDALYRFMAPLIEGVLKLPREAAPAFVLSIIRREFGVVALLTLTLSPYQMVVALITMTLLVPCISAMFVLYKQRGAKEASLILLFCTVMAFGVGGLIASIVM